MPKALASIYWPLWNATPLTQDEQENYKKMDRFLLAFANPNTQGILQYDRAVAAQLMLSLKHASQSSKILLSIGGWGSAELLANIFKSESLRLAFAKSCFDEIKGLGFDGIDLDWEFPGNDDTVGQQISNWVSTLRALSKKPILVTAAVSSNPTNFPRHLNRVFDSLYVMSYDFAGPWANWVTHNSDLITGKRSMAEWVTAGYDPSTLNLGVAAYGRSALVNPQNRGMSGMNAPALPGTWEEATYDQVQGLIRTGDFIKNWDSAKCAPWLWCARKGEVVTYEDSNVVTTKRIWTEGRGFQGCFMYVYPHRALVCRLLPPYTQRKTDGVPAKILLAP